MSSSESREHDIPRKPIPDTHTIPLLIDSINRPVHVQYIAQSPIKTIPGSSNEEQHTIHEHLPEEQHANLDHDIEEGEPLQASSTSTLDRMPQSTLVNPWKISMTSKAPNNTFFQSWRPPIMMFVGLIAGLLLAVTHHEMNSKLHGQIVHASGAFTQQWTSLYGISLAFLVRMSLVICVGIAFVQRLWLNFSTNHQPVQVKDFDTVTSALSDLFSLFSSAVWLRNPLLLLMALVTWFIPLAAIFTPGTLSIDSQPFTAINIENVPQLSFNSTSYAKVFNGEGYVYMYENREMTKAAYAAATSANILTMVPNHANSTYTLTFFGPALKCQDASDSLTLAASSAESNDVNGDWFEAYTDTPPWDWNSTSNGSYPWNQVDVSDMQRDSIGYNESDGNAIWVMSKLGEENVVYAGGFSKVNLTECRLQNASYKVNFTFTNFVQSTVVDEVVYMNPSYLFNYTAEELLTERDDAILSYKAIMSAFGGLLVGYLSGSQYGSPKPTLTHYDLLNIDFTRSETTMEGLEYLFQNITLSLFSTALFLKNVTNPVPVTVTTWSTVYKYDPANLLIAYGVVLLCSLVCCLVGFHACLISKGSYRNVFSTHVRAAYQSNLDASMLMEQHDRPTDPVPTAFKQKTMIIGNYNRDKEQ